MIAPLLDTIDVETGRRRARRYLLHVSRRRSRIEPIVPRCGGPTAPRSGSCSRTRRCARSPSTTAWLCARGTTCSSPAPRQDTSPPCASPSVMSPRWSGRATARALVGISLRFSQAGRWRFECAIPDAGRHRGAVVLSYPSGTRRAEASPPIATCRSSWRTARRSDNSLDRCAESRDHPQARLPREWHDTDPPLSPRGNPRLSAWLTVSSRAD